MSARKHTVRMSEWALVGALLLSANAASAHHSYASFEMSQTQTIQGAVSQWEWTNPHSFLHLLVSEPNGGTAEWIFESSSPALLTRHGFTRSTFHVGDHLMLLYHPSRATEHAGSLVNATFGDGTVMSVLNQDAGAAVLKP